MYQLPINKKNAQQTALKSLDPNPELSALGDELVIDPSVSYETKYSWIFCCNSKKYLKTRDIRYQILGIRLIAVEKKTGQVYHIGTGYSDRVLIALHELMLYPTVINRLRCFVLTTLYYLGIQL